MQIVHSRQMIISLEHRVVHRHNKHKDLHLFSLSPPLYMIHYGDPDYFIRQKTLVIVKSVDFKLNRG